MINGRGIKVKWSKIRDLRLRVQMRKKEKLENALFRAVSKMFKLMESKD